MIKNTFRKGFTLRGLLLLIGLLGVLSVVFIFKLREVHTQAQDTVLQTSIMNSRFMIEIFNIQNATYIGACDSLGVFSETIFEQGRVMVCTDTLHGSFTNYVQLIFTSDYFCVDVSGRAHVQSGPPVNPELSCL